MSAPVPEFLSRRGILSVSDNLDAGQAINPVFVSKQFSILFRDELAQAVLRKAECEKDKPGSSPCR